MSALSARLMRCTRYRSRSKLELPNITLVAVSYRLWVHLQSAPRWQVAYVEAALLEESAAATSVGEASAQYFTCSLHSAGHVLSVI